METNFGCLPFHPEGHEQYLVITAVSPSHSLKRFCFMSPLWHCIKTETVCECVCHLWFGHTHTHTGCWVMEMDTFIGITFCRNSRKQLPCTGVFSEETALHLQNVIFHSVFTLTIFQNTVFQCSHNKALVF